MIVRIWKTGIDRIRESDYKLFEEERSLPMFRKQTGFLGVLFLRSTDGAAALTFWESAEDVARLPESSTYRETVGQLETTGLLRGDQVIETFEVAATHLDPLDSLGIRLASWLGSLARPRGLLLGSLPPTIGRNRAAG